MKGICCARGKPVKEQGGGLLASVNDQGGMKSRYGSQEGVYAATIAAAKDGKGRWRSGRGLGGQKNVDLRAAVERGHLTCKGRRRRRSRMRV